MLTPTTTLARLNALCATQAARLAQEAAYRALVARLRQDDTTTNRSAA